jgi:hypothetical protein
MWTPENRPKYDRGKLRYPSDVTDEEWALIGPLIPPAKRGGNKRTIDERAVLNGVMSILSTGCRWQAALPGGAAEGPAAEKHGARLPPALGCRPDARSHPPRALRAAP